MAERTRWNTKIIDDRYAYAAYTDCSGNVTYEYVELRGFAFQEEAIREAVDRVLERLGGMRGIVGCIHEERA